jgi:hypothetical protein
MRHVWDPKAGPVQELVRPVLRDPTGRAGPTKAQAAGRSWRRTTPGFYVPADGTPAVVEQRILEQSMRIRSRGVVTGWAALRLHGAGFFDGLARDGVTALPVPIAANGERMGPHPEVLRVRDTVPPDEVVVRHEIRCASVHHALFDEMRRLRWEREAAVAADMVFAAELTSLSRFRRYVATRRWFRDVRRVGAALEMSDEHSRSPQESRFRMIWEYDAQWGRPLCNRPVYDLAGRLIGIPDLLDPVRAVVGEYDGADHRDREQHRADVRRADLFRRAGLEPVPVVGADLREPALVVERLKAAAARAGRVPRGWTLGEPGPSLDDLLDRRVTREAGPEGPETGLTRHSTPVSSSSDESSANAFQTADRRSR